MTNCKGTTVSAIAGVMLLVSLYPVICSGAETAFNLSNTGMADPIALINAFDRYVAGQTAAGAKQRLVMPLVALRGLTSESLNAGGNVTIDFGDGSVVSQVRGLPQDGAFDLWLMENRPVGVFNPSRPVESCDTPTSIPPL